MDSDDLDALIESLRLARLRAAEANVTYQDAATAKREADAACRLLVREIEDVISRRTSTEAS